MTSRSEVEQLLRALYATRIAGRRDELCALFAEQSRFRIGGTSDGKPISVSANGAAEIRTWLTMFVKTFKISEHEILSMVIEGERAAVHWRANIHSRITGTLVPTELVDLIEVRSAHITSYVEFFLPV
ncbi:MAG TPA: nuclear transport factor 2 family protein [Steroidobacteraceae bacterium]|nr:nuclear transport factor 2 family protein [Steroidobacteraceae bacterium]